MAEDGIKSIMEDKIFGASGNNIVVEEFLTGPEVSVLSFVDGKTIRIMTSAQDHKRAKDGDQGLNTGGRQVQSSLCIAILPVLRLSPVLTITPLTLPIPVMSM